MRLCQWDVDTEWNGDFGCRRGERKERPESYQNLPCQITNLFPTLVLIIKLKLLLHIDSSGCALVLSPIKQGEKKERLYEAFGGVLWIL